MVYPHESQVFMVNPMFSWRNRQDFDGQSRGPTRRKGERFERPQHGAEALRLAAEFEKNEKKWGLDWGTWERIWERLHEIMRSLENMSPFSILMIFFETYWGCNGDMGDLMSVLLMSFMHFILPNRRGFIFWREPLGKTGVNNP